jgi:hypothetical protein
MSLTKVHNRMVDGAYVNVKDFGAKTEFESSGFDSAAAIQAAIDSVDSVGGVVYIPAGQYNCSTSIVLTNAQSLVGVQIPVHRGGTDANSILLFTNDTNGIEYGGNSYRNGLYNLIVKSGITSGTSTKVGINWNRNGSGTFGLANQVKNCAVVLFDTGIYVGDEGELGYFQKYEDISLFNNKIGIVAAGSNGASEFSSVHIDAGSAWGINSRGVQIIDANGLTFTNLSIEKAYYAIDNQADKDNNRVYIFGLYVEASGSRDINIAGGIQLYIYGARFSFPSSSGYVLYTGSVAADNGKVIVMMRDIQLQTATSGTAWNRISQLLSDDANTSVEMHDVFLNGNINNLFADNAPDYISFSNKDKESNRVEFWKRNATSLIAKTIRSDTSSALGANTFVFDAKDGTTHDFNFSNSIVEYVSSSSTLARRIWSGSAWVDNSYS